jgi:hypothetical protein
MRQLPLNSYAHEKLRRGFIGAGVGEGLHTQQGAQAKRAGLKWDGPLGTNQVDRVQWFKATFDQCDRDQHGCPTPIQTSRQVEHPPYFHILYDAPQPMMHVGHGARLTHTRARARTYAHAHAHAHAHARTTHQTHAHKHANAYSPTRTGALTNKPPEPRKIIRIQRAILEYSIPPEPSDAVQTDRLVATPFEDLCRSCGP